MDMKADDGRMTGIFGALVLGLVFASPAMAGGFFGAFPEGGNTALEKANAAYLKEDFKTMAVEARRSLESAPNDPLVRESVDELFRKAYARGGKNGIAADWHLPDEIVTMKIGIRLQMREVPEYYLKVYGELQQEKIIKQLRITRFPNQVVMDKEKGVGEWEEGISKLGNEPEYGLSSRRSKQPIAGGLFLVDLELTNGKKVQGWFILNDRMSSSAAPELLTPSYGENFTTSSPTFRWADFRSPEYDPSERRTLWMGVSRSEAPSYAWEDIWEYYEDSPNLTEATIGALPGAVGVSKLDPGHYVLVLKYSENHRFGDVILQRASSVVRPFRVIR